MVLQIHSILDMDIRLIMPWNWASSLCLRCLQENGCDFNLQLNVKLYDRKELSGQKHCRPAQVLDREKEAVGQFISQDGYFFFSSYFTGW